MIGNNYRWGHGAHAAGHRALEEVGGQVVGNEFVELGHLDFGRVIEEIERSGADCVLSTLVGADEVAFERQVWEAGLRTKWATLSLAMEESARERIGDDAAAGIWAALGYFEGLDTTENKALLGRYRGKYGRWAPPLSSLSESVYEAVALYAAAVRNGRGDVRGVAEALREIRMTMPEAPSSQPARTRCVRTCTSPRQSPGAFASRPDDGRDAPASLRPRRLRPASTAAAESADDSAVKAHRDRVPIPPRSDRRTPTRSPTAAHGVR
ncbi:hypothetical protein EIL87_10320 [Saccharopolyspora rhizosphaerae]|uniref:Leucine-binding protein domain-containing protein n=1 Tax=Saccharopolyspora rhizosphaerae TaxID=2492662 RepID=A0A3R8Q5Z9_9PSEU|nr:hypothetical protein EIL87_10320 [Saccharopolyspora rhizosphaerae]